MSELMIQIETPKDIQLTNHKTGKSFSSQLLFFSDQSLIIKKENLPLNIDSYDFSFSFGSKSYEGTAEIGSPPHSDDQLNLTINHFKKGAELDWKDYFRERLRQLTARDVMHGHIITTPPDTIIRDVVITMNERKIGSILVCNDDQSEMGIFTERDILIHGYKEDFFKRPVSDYMTASPNTVEADASMEGIYHKFRNVTYRHLPVTDANKVIGMISTRDLIKYWTKLVEIEKESITLEYEKAMGVIVHDLRSPIYAVKSINELILTGMEEPDSYAKDGFPQMVQDSCETMINLINDLLNISSIRAGTHYLERETVDIVKTTQDVIKTFEAQAQQKQIIIQENYSPESFEYELDPKRWGQVVQNLLSNGVKYAPVDSKIDILLEEKDGSVCFSVTDYGQGISEKELPRVFDELCKISSKPTANEPSTGLGLSITKRLVEAHSGKISVESEPNKRTCFKVILPPQ